MLRFFLAALLVCSASAKWVDLYAFPWSGVPLPLMLSVACPNSTICFVSGGTHSMLPHVFYTTDEFKSVNEANMEKDGLLIVDIDFNEKGNNGVGGGVGALKLPGLVYTKDYGNTWKGTADLALIETSDVVSRGGSDWAMVGSLDSLLGKEGVGISTDGGYRWEPHNWSPATKSSVPPGCYPQTGAFFGSTWYVVCGSQPEEQSSSEPEAEEDEIKSLTLSSSRYTLQYNRKARYSKVVGGHLKGNYTGGILKSTDSGSTWTVQMKEAGKYYIEDICCASATNCIALAYGINGPYNATDPGSHVFSTTDGKTWTNSYNFPIPILIDKCRYEPNTKAYWIGGGSATSILNAHALFWSSTDGKTWTQEGSIKGLEGIIDFNFVVGSKGKLAYGLGATTVDSITPLKYTA